MTANLLLRDLFVYPIERYIPPVAKVDDLTEATVGAELREYVMTSSIERALTDFLEVYVASRTEPTDKIGVWISGFFGSGKSHFAKVLNCLLRNPTVGGRPAREIFMERLAGSARRPEIEGLLHRAGLLDSHVIMFNIKAEQDQHNPNEGISEIMYRRYLAFRGLSTVPEVASLEFSLIRRGLYQAFQEEVERKTGRPWSEERDDFLFIRSTVAEALQAIAPEAYPSQDEALAALQMVEHGQRLAVSDLAERLVHYVDDLAQRGDAERPPRLVFVMDEMGQFVGTDGQRLLELQSIAEEFATKGRGRLWLIVTAQARLQEIIDGAEAMNADFGKIGARFDTRLALGSEDVEKVLEGRILKKKEGRIPDIHAFYRRHEGVLTALSGLPGASRELPGVTVERFTAATPFLPYHTALIQAIFAGVQSATATGFGVNAEVRSMIGMAQGVLSTPSNGFVDGELGRIVSADMVYDHIAADLRPQDRREIESLPERLPGYQELDRRVLKALYLLQAVPWIVVTSETLAHALLCDVRNENVASLRAEVKKSLQRLKAARYVIPKGDDVWEFLTGTKKSFEEETASVTVRQNDRRREVRRMLGEILRPVGKLNYQDGLRTFDVTIRGDGEELRPGGEMTLEVYSPLHVALESLNLQDLEQVESFSHPETVYWVSEESPELEDLVTRVIRLEAVLETWQQKPSKTDEEWEIVREKGTELNRLRGTIESALRTALTNGTIVWNGRAEELDGRTTTLNPIFNRVASQVVPSVYPKFHLAAVKPNEDDIKAVLTVAAFTLPTVASGLDLFDKEGHLNQHSAVVDEVLQELKRRAYRGGDLSGKALEEHFTGGDYGWHPVIVRLILAAMFRAGIVSVKADNVHYASYTVPAAQVIFAQVHPFRRAVFIYEEEEAVEPGELRRAQDELRIIFDVVQREETANALAAQIQEQMGRWSERAERVALELRPAGYPIPETVPRSHDLRDRISRFPNPGKVVKAFLENLEEVRAWHAEVQTLYEFIRDKKLTVFERSYRLLKEVQGAEDIPGAEPLAKEDARRWRATLEGLIAEGCAAHQWDEFVAAYTPLHERYRQVYRSLHQERDKVYGREAAALSADGIAADGLRRYGCEGLDWDDDGLRCRACGTSPEALDLHIRLIPTEAQNIRKTIRDKESRDKKEKVKYIRMAGVVPKRRIRNEGELEEALGALRQEVTEALGEVDTVELE